ncbi:hypothetical protein PPACK8108_LOCUS10770 [Phakopsora pachyrhizi]|uniref:Uncharacterized protein n=1 Tax=Phakopsora pachyrhizi TaxID=170000 RepID=A0AAV0AYY6_PHAPC|nr:hypothetical protein PPACK8108_LOCUS10770 [Phakopsora pachyrhizi]
MKFYFSPIAGRWDEKLEDVGSELEILPQTVSDSVMTRRHWAATAATDQSPLTSAYPLFSIAIFSAHGSRLGYKGRGEWTGGADGLLSEVHESNKKFVLRELKITN